MAKRNKNDPGSLSFKLEKLAAKKQREQVMLNVRMDKDLYDSFKQICDGKLKLSISEAIRQILQQAVEQNDGPYRRVEGIGRDSSMGKNKNAKK